MNKKEQKTGENYTHDRLQQEVFQHIYNTYPETRGNFWHTPNEFIPDTFIQAQVKRVCGDKIPNFLVQIFDLHKKHFLSSLSKRKSIGVLAGVTDITGYWRGVLLMLDIKLPGDSLSEAQIRFIKSNELQGGKFIEVNTLEQAIKDLHDFFTPPTTF